MSINDAIEKESFRNYRDRGLVKLLGFYLSDHTLALSDDQTGRRKTVSAKPQLSEQEINDVMELAITKNLMVAVQVNERDHSNQFLEDIVGAIIGYDDKTLYIGKSPVPFDLIRHIEIYSDTKG